MLNTKLPIVKKSFDETTQKLNVVQEEIEVSVDTSLFAEERWEANFPINAKKETLFAYIERVKDTGLIESKANILSNLKALYCFLEGKDIADFKSFCQLFDLAEGEYLNKLIEKIKFIFELVLKSSTTDSKN